MPHLASGGHHEPREPGVGPGPEQLRADVALRHRDPRVRAPPQVGVERARCQVFDPTAPLPPPGALPLLEGSRAEALEGVARDQARPERVVLDETAQLERARNEHCHGHHDDAQYRFNVHCAILEAHCAPRGAKGVALASGE